MSDSLDSLEPPDLTTKLLLESEVMLHHALDKALQAPPTLAAELIILRRQLADDFDQTALTHLVKIHNRLSQTVAPAVPSSLVFLDQESRRKGLLTFLGPVGLVRRLMLVALLSVVALFALSLAPQVDGSPANFSLLKNSGIDLFLNEIFLLAAASLGVSFANLYQAQIFLKNNTFDPRFESTYWVRYVLGIMAGTILAFLIPVEQLFEAGAPNSEHGMAKPTLALLGGFSAQVLYRILIKMVSAVESLVQGNLDESLATREAQLRLDLDRKDFQLRIEQAQRLRELRDKLGDELARDEVEQMIDELTSGFGAPFISIDSSGTESTTFRQASDIRSNESNEGTPS